MGLKNSLPQYIILLISAGTKRLSFRAKVKSETKRGYRTRRLRRKLQNYCPERDTIAPFREGNGNNSSICAVLQCQRKASS